MRVTRCVRVRRALVTMDEVRHPNFPDVPTVAEALGVRWNVAHWRGIVAPRGLAPAVTQRYVEALEAVAQDPAFASEAAASAFTVRWRFGADFAACMVEDDRRFGHVIGLLEGK